MPRPYQSKEDSAVEVWVALEEAQTAGLTLVELIEKTGLTRNQVKAGLTEINHIKQLADEQPIMVRTEDWAYVLPEYHPELLPWTINRLNDMLTRLQTEQTRFLAANAKWPKDVGAMKQVPKLLKRIIEDVSEVLNTVEP